MQRALKGLKHKQVVKTVWQSHGATTFTVWLPWELARKPSFLPRPSRLGAPSPTAVKVIEENISLFVFYMP
jgi:hypothetical protein